MKLFTWSDELATGLDAVDSQHHELVKRINSFLKLSASGDCGRDDLVKTFRFLRTYALEHFAWEKSLMQQTDYPTMVSHLNDHARLRAWVERMAGQLATIELGTNVILDINYHLIDWLQQHFKTVDRRMTDHVREYAKRHEMSIKRLLKQIFQS